MRIPRKKGRILTDAPPLLAWLERLSVQRTGAVESMPDVLSGTGTEERPACVSAGTASVGTITREAASAGMVLSIETTMNHPKRGLVKLEDTVLVTEGGWRGLGDGVRGWQPTAG